MGQLVGDLLAIAAILAIVGVILVLVYFGSLAVWSLLNGRT